MQIIHVDVDSNLAAYLSGEKFENSLKEYADSHDTSMTEGVSVKLAARCDKELLSRFPSLKLLVTRTVGLDHIDLDYCKEKGIVVQNIPDYGSFNIAEHAFALLLAGTRNIVKAHTATQQGSFAFQDLLGYSLKGKTLGVIGTGKIGIEMIRRAVGFEMEIIAYDLYQNEDLSKELGFHYSTLDALISTSDIISLHSPLLDTTRHMINEERILEMKEGVILINTARGGLIDTNALVQYIHKFRFIGLDVVEGEDTYSKEHPLIGHPNIIITPHVAYYSDASIKKIAQETEKHFKNFESNDHNATP